MSIRSTATTFLLLFVLAFTGTSCKKKCKTCDIGETCNPNAGYCFCPNGLEGDSCNTLSATKYIHSYLVNEACSGSASYNVNVVSIYDPEHPNRLNFNNLFNVGAVEVDIYSNNNKQGIDLQVPDQVIGGIEVSGSGQYQSVNGYARITLNVSYLSGGAGSNCTVIMNQQ